MKSVILIRHGMTAGNEKRQYIGRTDEVLCEKGKQQAEALREKLSSVVFKETSHMMSSHGHNRLYSIKLGQTQDSLCVDRLQCIISGQYLIVSPMNRCVETASVLFPGVPQIPVADLREMDFGIFEGKSADELKNSRTYTDWVMRGCTGDIPGGENVESFKRRCCQAFFDLEERIPDDSTACYVIHGGAIMAIMERFGRPKKEFYEYHIGNCKMISCRYEGGFLSMTEGLSI